MTLLTVVLPTMSVISMAGFAEAKVTPVATDVRC